MRKWLLLVFLCTVLAGLWYVEPQYGRGEPSCQQINWQKKKLGMFVHFGMATFSGKVGAVVPPDTFCPPENINYEQWMFAAKAMGARYVTLTAQHTDGFLLWQSDAYDYGVRQCKWKGGSGDVVKEFVAACRRNGLAPGIYLNLSENHYWGVEYPGIVKEGVNTPEQKRYNRIVEKMVQEICSNYGELFELWFDSGVLMPEDGGPDIASIIKRLQPNAMVMQGQSASTIRLAGGENGMIELPFWNRADRYYTMGRGGPDGKYYLPVECDAPVRKKQWFWREDTDDNLVTVDALRKMYEGSINRGANLLLNANPDKSGLIPEKDMALYTEFGKLNHNE